MLSKMFMQVLNMSLTSSVVILFVIVIRLLLKKAPKIFSYAIWSATLLRLICPFSFESMFSILPAKVNSISQDIVYAAVPEISSGGYAFSDAVNAALPISSPDIGENPFHIWVLIGGIIWCSGMISLLLSGVINPLRLKKHLKGAVLYKSNIYFSDRIDTALVTGILCPKNYIPVNLSETEKEFILLHEQAHIRQFDNLVRLICFIVLWVHWFIPLSSKRQRYGDGLR